MLRLLEVPNCIPCKPAHVFILQRKRSCNFDTLKYEHLCVMQSVRLSASTCYVCLRELFLFSQSLAFEGKRCSPVGRLTELFRLSGRQRTPHSYFSAHFIFFFPLPFSISSSVDMKMAGEEKVEVSGCRRYWLPFLQLIRHYKQQ